MKRFHWHTMVIDLVALALCFLAVGIAIAIVFMVRATQAEFTFLPLLMGFSTAAILGLIAVVVVETNRLLRENTTVTVETKHLVNSQLEEFKAAIAEAARVEIARQGGLRYAEGVAEGVQQEQKAAAAEKLAK